MKLRICSRKRITSILCFIRGSLVIFFFNDTATTEIYTLSLHDALPISCRERLAEFARRREDLQAQVAQQQALVGQLSTERAQIDWTPVEASLQEQLAARAAAEQALSAARDRQEALAAELRTGEEARLSIEHQLEPARAKIEDMRLKQQAAELSEQQFIDQLAEAHADLI